MFLFYVQLFMELLKELLQHPLFISLFISIITILFGKFLILDKILPGKIVDLKINTINKVVELKNLMKDVKLYYNRMINTLKLSENREYWPEGRKGYQQGIISSETQKISELINDIINDSIS